MKFLDWLEALPPSVWVAESDWGYPLMLSAHSIGMAAVVGLMLILDFWVLGLARGIPLSAFRRFMPFAWAGFLINLASGVLLFDATAHRLLINWAFLTKMGCIVVAGAVTWLLWRSLRDGDAPLSGAAIRTSKQSKGLAWLSISLWLAAITCGRLIAYVMDHAILAGQA